MKVKIGAIQLSAILASLLLSAGLVLRISATLIPVAPETRSDTAARQAVQLRDGAYGVSLFEDFPIAPGHIEDRCITVRATGTRTPEVVLMEAQSRIDPMLAPWLRLDVARGPAIGDGRSCDGFVEEETLVAGRSDMVMEALERGVEWVPDVTQRIERGHEVAFRLRASLLPDAPDDIQGAEMGFDLFWSTDFDAAGEGLLDRTLALAIRFTEDSMIPMLAILALAILFLGIQDRLDTATPRLSQAALFDEVVRFRGGEEPVETPVEDGARDPVGPGHV